MSPIRTPYTLEGNLIGDRQETSECFSGLSDGMCLNGHFPVTLPDIVTSYICFKYIATGKKVTGGTVITMT